MFVSGDIKEQLLQEFEIAEEGTDSHAWAEVDVSLKGMIEENKNLMHIYFGINLIF